ncbi:hypothetical protein D5086_026326 [Populus alba]|uniref:Uncharacterized protein n=1 Tax=Populus alba TaxID=43335 RepID=A0ACC4B379_POPAL
MHRENEVPDPVFTKDTSNVSKDASHSFSTDRPGKQRIVARVSTWPIETQVEMWPFRRLNFAENDTIKKVISYDPSSIERDLCALETKLFDSDIICSKLLKA